MNHLRSFYTTAVNYITHRLSYNFLLPLQHLDSGPMYTLDIPKKYSTSYGTIHEK